MFYYFYIVLYSCCSSLQNEFYFFPNPRHTNSIQDRFLFFGVFVVFIVFLQIVPRIEMFCYSGLLYSFFSPPTPPPSRACSLTVWHSHVSILYDVYHNTVSLVFALILEFKYLQITIAYAFSFSILFPYFLSEFHLQCISFLWPFVISPNCYLFFFHQFYPLPIKQKKTPSFSICSKSRWRAASFLPPSCGLSQVLFAHMGKAHPLGLHAVLARGDLTL